MEMLAGSVVSFVVDRLGDLLIKEAKLFRGLSGQVKQIQTQLSWMQCFITDADAMQDEGAMVRHCIVDIRELAYETEDVIETFFLRFGSRRGGGVKIILHRYMGCCLKECISRHKVGSEIQSIKSKLSDLIQRLPARGLTQREAPSSSFNRKLLLRRSYSNVVDDDFVGMEEDVKKLVELLVNEEKSCRVVSICGMGGSGKTTLARKVYNSIGVQRYFEGFVWVCISQQWEKEDVLRRILIKLVPEKKEEIYKMTDEELIRLLLEVVQTKKCLVVLDDIWFMDAWDCLRPAFPIGNMGTKLLLTTRNMDVASHLDPEGFLHEQRLLDENESWELLQKKAFTKTAPRDDKRMELGKKMASRCGGLPLAVVVLGGILVSKHSWREWEMVHGNIDSYLRRGKGIGEYGGVLQVLALSYIDLPFQLKPCFLYLASFMEDSVIEAEKLYHLWMAEGMVWSQDRAEEETMMDVAERYLGELAQRCMVQVQVDELTTRFKSCRLHDLMRDLCLSKGKEEDFLKVIVFRSGEIKEYPDSSPSSSISKIRRVAIYSEKDVHRCMPLLLETARHLRSLLFFNSGDEIRITLPRIIKIHFKDFKLLRVLNLEGFEPKIETDRVPLMVCDCLLDHWNLPEAIGNLIHLRYLSIRYSYFRGLPSSIGSLQSLQTLDLRVRGDVFSWPNVLHKMVLLRHLYLPRYILEGKKLRIDGLSNLEILENFDPGCIDVRHLYKLTNLRKLTAVIKANKLEDLVVLIEFLTTHNRLRYLSIKVLGDNFCSAEELTLTTQLIGCHRLDELEIFGAIDNLPEYNHFSQSLTKLTLYRCQLTEDPMATLEKLPNLWSLSLESDAFVGKEMVCSTMGFPQLRVLFLFCLNQLEEWRVDEKAMPNLSHLRICSCWDLKMVPDGLISVNSLRKMEIWDMPEAFTKRLRVMDGEGGEDFYKVRHVPSITFSKGS